MLALLTVAVAAEITLPRADGAALVVDGRGDEPAWALAVTLGDPTVFRPSDSVPPVGSVVTRLLATEDALWAHFVVTDPEPGEVFAGLGRRDAREDDYVSLLIDPAGDGRRAYELIVTPLGLQLDKLHESSPFGGDDYSWDAVWRSAGHRTPTGYEVELAIPWSALYMTGDVESFGLVLLRGVARKGQQYAWPPVDAGTDPLLATAVVHGPGALPRKLGLELLPELTGAWSNPHEASGRLELAGIGPGITARYAPGGGFRLLATLNPDFSQLESDATQIDVNQRYALSYEEKRPFFLEGQEWFSHPYDGVIYTRSMIAPLYGVRATGEVGAVGVSVMNVLDQSPAPSVNEQGGWTAEDLDGHQALDSLARVRFSLGGDSYIGVLASDKTILGTDLANRVISVDTGFRPEKRLLLRAAVLGSSTTFSDRAAPALAPAGVVDALWSGEHLFLHGGAGAETIDFRQENGFVTIADSMGAFTEDHVLLTPKLDWLQALAIEPIDGWAYFTLAGVPRLTGYDPSVWARFGNGAFVKVDGRLGGESFAGSWVDYRRLEAYGSIEAGESVRVEAGGVVGTNPYYDASDPRAGRYQEAWAGLALQPVDALTLELEPGLVQMQELTGEPLFVAWTGRAKAELFLSRVAWVRGVAELTGEDGGLQDWRIEPVTAAEWTPGRAVYVGGAVGREVEEVDGAATGAWRPVYWQVFAKVSWRFEL